MIFTTPGRDLLSPFQDSADALLRDPYLLKEKHSRSIRGFLLRRPYAFDVDKGSQTSCKRFDTQQRTLLPVTAPQQARNARSS